MWNIVASIQHTLDEAAGLSEQPLRSSRSVSPAVEHSADSGDVADDYQDEDVVNGNREYDEGDNTDDGEVPTNAVVSLAPADECSRPVVESAVQGDGHDVSSQCSGPLGVLTSSFDATPQSGTSVQKVDDAPVNQSEPTGPPSARPVMPVVLNHHQRAREIVIPQPAPYVDTALEKKCQLLAATIASLKCEGQELASQLGTERERSKHLLQEKRVAEARVSDLQGLLDAYAVKEKRWEAAKHSFQIGEATQRERISSLESAMMRQADDFRRLSEDSGINDEKRRASETLLRATNQSLEEQLLVLQQEHKEEIEQLQGELLLVRHNHRQAIGELEQQLAEERRELAAATQRAHLAENQLLDDQCSMSASMQEVSTQVEQLQHLVSTLQKQLHAKQQELTDAHQAARHVQAQLAEVEDRCEQRVKAVASDKRHLQKELQASVDSLERQRTRCDELLRLNDELHRTVSALRTTESKSDDAKADAVPNLSAAVGSATASVSQPQPVIPSTSVAAGGPAQHSPVKSMPHADSSPGSSLQASSSSSFQRMEREIARLTKEVRRLKGAEDASCRYKAQLDNLLKQHDTLLQMYGQLEEELSDALRDAKSVKRVFQDQLDLMAFEVERLTANTTAGPK